MADYINGKELTAELKKYREMCFAAEAEGKEIPIVTDRIANGIIQIATRLANSWNFVNYTYKDEMVSDAIVKCLTKIRNFDPEKSENSFAFLTQVCWNCYLERIKIEQYQTSVKAKFIKEKLSNEFIEQSASIENEEAANAFVEFLKDNEIFVDHIEERQKASIHESLKHRNKTAYIKKDVIVIEPAMDLSQFEE